MEVILDETIVRSLPWHDSNIHFLNVSRSDDDILLVLLRIEINPEESFQLLLDLGINTFTLDIIFKDVWRFRSDFRGDVQSREVLLDWNIIKESSLISEIKNYGVIQDIDLYHHQLQLSSGSIIDIVFGKAHITEVSQQ